MVSRLALLLLLAVAPAVRGGIDLTPVAHVTEFEGVRVKQMGFRNGGSFVMYQPPGKWEIKGGGRRLVLIPGATLADAAIEAHPGGGKTSLDIETLEQVRRELVKSLPQGAERIEWEEIELNPVLLNMRQTRRLTVTYTAYAQRMKTTMVVCQFEEDQIRFTLATRDIDFEKLYEEFRRSLYTWQGMK